MSSRTHIIMALVFLLTGSSVILAETGDDVKFREIWDDPVLKNTIDQNIETYRKETAFIKVVSEKGKPVPGAVIEVEQLSHEFLFGCNLFYLKGFETDEQNEKYESSFLRLFNFATVPFYWSDLEPERGKVRFEKDSKFIPRRPPPDLCVEWGLKHSLTLKGHPLSWHFFYPDWLPEDQGEVTRIFSDRFRQIAERYKDSINIWDVVNEAVKRPEDMVFPEDYFCWSYKEADKWFGADNILMANEDTPTSYNFHKEDSYYYLLLMKLKLSNIRFDGIGFQFHVWNYEEDDQYKELISGETYNPWRLMDIYRQYSDFGKPLYITEITVPTVKDDTEGQAMQAYIVRNLYRLWFSIPNMAGITWWNLGDLTAHSVANAFGGGLIDKNLEPKESFTTLDQLINHEWRTRENGKTFDNGIFHFRGFYGTYRIKVKHGKIEQEYEINISKDGDVHKTLVMNE